MRGKSTTNAPNTAPVRAVGEHEYGWYLLDYNDDHVAEGTDPTNWDTDGDWMVDWFEVNDDEQDGIRGETSPIRYDSSSNHIVTVMQTLDNPSSAGLPV